MSKVRQLILETLNQRGPLPVDEIARAVNLSTMAARYHMGLLAREGLVVARVGEHRGIVGRPQMLYELEDAASDYLPSRYDLLAEGLLDAVVQRYGEREGQSLLREIGKRVAQGAGAPASNINVDARLSRAVKFLNRRDYAAHWRRADGEYVLQIHNCPYRQLARSHHQICEMDSAMVETLLQLPIRQSHWIARQDRHCRFRIAGNSRQ